MAAGRPKFGPAFVMSVKPSYRLAAAALALMLVGCVSVPSGPSRMALPGSTKGFDQFRFDDGSCRQYASDSIGGQGSVARAQDDSAVRSVVAGAAIGAVIGAAISGGHGAAVGAGVGAGAGGLAGIGAAEATGFEGQRRYDQAYTQCMYGKGHRVAVSGHFAPHAAAAPPPPARASYPPPPPPPGYYSTPRTSGLPVPPPGSAPGY